MLGSNIAAALALATTAAAAPGGPWGSWGGGHWGPPGPCLNDSGADYLISQYAILLEQPQGPDFLSISNAILSDSFFVSADSINTLAGYPLGVPAYPSKQAFIAGQAKTPAIPSVQTLETFHTCDKIAWRWNGTGIGSNMLEVKGIITMNVDASSVQIDAVYSEFNSGAWLSDIGNPECQKK